MNQPQAVGTIEHSARTHEVFHLLMDAIQERDPLDEPDFQATSFLVAAWMLETADEAAIQRLCSLTPELCARFAARALAGGIFDGLDMLGKYGDEELGSVALMLDAQTLLGMFERTPGEEGDGNYKLTVAGTTYVEQRLLPKAGENGEAA